jgi:voltage-gated potassium channel Kch
MFVSFVLSHALSVAPPLASDAMDLVQPGSISKWLGSVQGRLFYAFIKISLVLIFGALVFYADEDKYFFGDGFLKNDQYEGRTFIDALFLASVIASTVGYGHLLTPLTDGAKAFLIFYFFFSTYVVGALLGEVLDIYVNGFIGENIVKKLIGSTTWVHKADMFGDGRISESAFILFKLIQMQAVDVGTLDRLIDAYHDLDKTGDGFLTIGVEVPSADQVREMQRIKDETKNPKSLPEIWKDIRSTHPPPDPNADVNYHVQYFRFNECYDFAWSRQLWANATIEIFRVAIVTLMIYVGLSFYTLTWLEGLRGIDSWYFLIATVTTVGFGDFAPTKQITRGFAIFLIPIGLIVYSLVMSFFSAYTKSQTPPSLNKKKDVRLQAAVSLQSAWRGRKVRNLQGLKASAKQKYVTHTIATANPKPKKAVVSASLPASLSSQYAKVLLKLAAVIGVGAFFVKLYHIEAERLRLTWVEALYLSVQTVTSVGYGDITLTSDGGKIFMIFFMFVGKSSFGAWCIPEMQ